MGALAPILAIAMISLGSVLLVASLGTLAYLNWPRRWRGTGAGQAAGATGSDQG